VTLEIVEIKVGKGQFDRRENVSEDVTMVSRRYFLQTCTKLFRTERRGQEANVNWNPENHLFNNTTVPTRLPLEHSLIFFIAISGLHSPSNFPAAILTALEHSGVGGILSSNTKYDTQD
jgi:hypothetical protein